MVTSKFPIMQPLDLDIPEETSTVNVWVIDRYSKILHRDMPEYENTHLTFHPVPPDSNTLPLSSSLPPSQAMTLTQSPPSRS